MFSNKIETGVQLFTWMYVLFELRWKRLSHCCQCCLGVCVLLWTLSIIHVYDRHTYYIQSMYAPYRAAQLSENKAIVYQNKKNKKSKNWSISYEGVNDKKLYTTFGLTCFSLSSQRRLNEVVDHSFGLTTYLHTALPLGFFFGRGGVITMRRSFVLFISRKPAVLLKHPASRFPIWPKPGSTIVTSWFVKKAVETGIWRESFPIDSHVKKSHFKP